MQKELTNRILTTLAVGTLCYPLQGRSFQLGVKVSF